MRFYRDLKLKSVLEMHCHLNRFRSVHSFTTLRSKSVVVDRSFEPQALLPKSWREKEATFSSDFHRAKSEKFEKNAMQPSVSFPTSIMKTSRSEKQVVNAGLGINRAFEAQR